MARTYKRKFTMRSPEEKEVLEEQRDSLSPIVKYMINPGYADVDANLSVFEKTNAAINAAFSCISTLVAEKIIK
jgi:TPP-dependent pyruvate/acetoin dehydrogenase alpha subunit